MGPHAVQIYDEVDELAEPVAEYFAAGFDLGEPAVIVATPEHRDSFSACLAALGWEPERLEREHLLLAVDADTTLRAIMGGESPSADAFDQVIGGLLDGVEQRFPDRQARVFGEMVDLLAGRGNVAAAVALEELWNQLGRRRSFSLLCAYRLDVFDRATQVWPLPSVCRLHSHVEPARDSLRFASAVDHALEEVLGPTEAGKVYAVVGEQVRQDRVPLSQLALMWISSNMPVLADRVLASARKHYTAAAA